MYVAITNTGVYVGKSLKDINKKSKCQFDADEFHAVGNDFVVNVNSLDFSFLQDKKRLSMIPMRNLYKKDNVMIFIIINLFLTLICVFKGGW